jgi:hypothetical protein
MARGVRQVLDKLEPFSLSQGEIVNKYRRYVTSLWPIDSF